MNSSGSDGESVKIPNPHNLRGKWITNDDDIARKSAVIEGMNRYDSHARAFIMAFSLVIMLCLGGCGRKPVGLLPPDDATADAYPQVYPKPQPNEMDHASIPDAVDSKYKARPDQSLQ